MSGRLWLLLPFDGTTHARNLLSGALAGLRDLLHRLEQVAPDISGRGLLAALVRVDDDVVAVGLRRPEPDDGLRPEPLVGDDLVEHRQGIVVQRAGGVGELGVGVVPGPVLEGELLGLDEEVKVLGRVGLEGGDVEVLEALGGTPFAPR